MHTEGDYNKSLHLCLVSRHVFDIANLIGIYVLNITYINTL